MAPSYRVKTASPASVVPATPDVIVAESFGSQFWAVVADEVSATLKHSSTVKSVEPGTSLAASPL